MLPLKRIPFVRESDCLKSMSLNESKLLPLLDVGYVYMQCHGTTASFWNLIYSPSKCNLLPLSFKKSHPWCVCGESFQVASWWMEDLTRGSRCLKSILAWRMVQLVLVLPKSMCRVIIPWRRGGCIFLLSELHGCLCVVMSIVSNDTSMSFIARVPPKKKKNL